MKLPRGFLLAVGTVPFARLASAQATGVGRPSAIRDGLTRLAEDNISDGGIAEVHPIPPGDVQVGEALVKELEGDDQTTVVGDVELGELLCDSLADAPGSTLLRFAITSNQTVVAERTSFSSVDGSVLADGNERKIWMGDVVDPEPAFPSTASMSWTDPCDVESFLLKIVSPNTDGTTTIFKSVPCSAGSSTELCMVEVLMTFNDEEEEAAPLSLEPVLVDEEGVRKLTEVSPAAKNAEALLGARGLRGLGGHAAAKPSGRELMGATQVDVMVLYSTEAWSNHAMTEQQLLTNIAAGFQTSDAAMVNSAVNLQFNLVHVGQLPYNQMTYDPNASSINTSPELSALRDNQDVLALRNLHRADLVMLIGYFPGTCGLGYIFNGNQINGFSLTDATCFDNLSHTHEMAHNFGCFHNRENSTTIHDYRHGFRYCDGPQPYRTIMAYVTRIDAEEPCWVPRVNYFSNPDVIFQGKPTGDADNDNARCIEDSMAAVSLFRDTCVADGTACESRDDCCSDFCLDDVCAVDACGEAGGSFVDIGDSVCNPANNNAECNWDGGDCCECDCDNPINAEWSCVASAVQEGPRLWVFGGFGQCSTLISNEAATACGFFQGGTCDCMCNEETIEGVCGSGSGFDCADPDSTCGTTPCTSDAQCTLPEQCCPVKEICEVPVSTNPLACGDPHMTGFRGQKFDFTGDDGEWYCLISDAPSMHMNMRVTAPVPSMPEITYITGLSVVTADAEGVDHSIVIEVTNPRSLESACHDGVSPCLADGALTVTIDGSEQLLQPGTVSVAQDVTVSAANLPGECRSFGFEKYWERKKLEYAQATGRRLSGEQSMGEWIVGDPTATNMKECMEYVAKATAGGEEGLFEHQSEHASFQIVTPTATVRLSHGKLHQLPMRDPTDRFDLPDHLTWQMNLGLERNDVSTDATGVLGETLVPSIDEEGHEIMSGMESIRGSQEDYRVAGPLGVHFAQGASA